MTPTIHDPLLSGLRRNIGEAVAAIVEARLNGEPLTELRAQLKAAERAYNEARCDYAAAMRRERSGRTRRER